MHLKVIYSAFLTVALSANQPLSQHTSYPEVFI